MSSVGLELRVEKVTFAAFLLAQVAVLWAIYSGLTNPVSILILALIAGVVALAVTVNFELASYLFVIFFLFNQDLTTGMRVRIADLIAVLLILSFGLRVFVTGEIKLRKTPLDIVILCFLAVLGLSLVNTKSVMFGTINYLRHIQLFLVMYALYHCLNTNHFKKLLYLFLIIVATNALISNVVFIASGGGFRSFGLAGNEFTDMVVPASLICYVFYFFERSAKNRGIYLFAVLNFVIALFATGTRGALVSWGIGFILANLILFRQATVNKRKVIQWALVVPVVLLILAAAFRYQTSHGVVSPYQGFVDTVGFRFTLWHLAIKSFLAHPILGIGLNQFMRLHEVYPAVKFNVLYPYIQGLDAHSVVLNFAANTGMLGLTLLFILFYKILKLGWQTYKKFQWYGDAKFILALAIVLTYVVYSSFYAGLWFWSLNGFEFMFFLAMLLKFRANTIKGA
jgi:O-antigen ligase